MGSTRGDAEIRVMGSVRISNAWLLRDAEGRRFLIDTGHRLERPALARELRRAGVRGPGDLSALLLTHRHSDHAGNAAWVRETFRCPVVAHEEDALRLDGRLDPPRLAPLGARHVHRLLCHIEDRFPARSAVDEVFEEGAPYLGFLPIPVAGHTEGSVLLLHEPSGALFSGDAILTGAPVQRLFSRLRLCVPDYSIDAEACRASVRAFLREDPPVRALCSGHGPMLRRGLRESLQSLR